VIEQNKTNPDKNCNKVSVDIELSKVYSFEKKQDLLNVLHSDNPSHSERLWFVGFLHYIGYNTEEICDIIHQEASWSDYDVNMTYNQVVSVCGRPGRSGNTIQQHSVVTGFSSHVRGVWIKRDEWNKKYNNRPLCTLHNVSCKNCPDINRNCPSLAGRR